MKGVILAGGSGTRLYPVTLVANKHLLPIYNKPMIYYPLSTLMLADIREILLITRPEDIESFKALLGDGKQLGIKIEYKVQEKPRGLADGLILAEEFADGDDICLILGDNIFFGHNLPDKFVMAKKSVENERNAVVFGYYVPDPERYGIVEFDKEDKVVSVAEKPEKPKSNWALVGLYFYPNEAIKVANSIKPSDRGELEITTVNEEYLKKGDLSLVRLGRGFAWFDAGTHESFLDSSTFISTLEKQTGYMIGCVEEVAYQKGWIDSKMLRKQAEPLKKTGYGQYLFRLAEEGNK